MVLQTESVAWRMESEMLGGPLWEPDPTGADLNHIRKGEVILSLADPSD